jgi:hypothetical protein
MSSVGRQTLRGTVSATCSCPTRVRRASCDAVGNVYVADHGNARIQAFDSSLTLRAVYHGTGKPWAICVTPEPHRYPYSSSNVETDLERGVHNGGEVSKMELDGSIVGRVGRADKPEGGFPTRHPIDCSQQNQSIAVSGSIPAYIVRVQP